MLAEVYHIQRTASQLPPGLRIYQSLALTGLSKDLNFLLPFVHHAIFVLHTEIL
jgi:hypothetical protein